MISYVAGIGAARILGAPLSSFVGLTEVLFAVLFAWLVAGRAADRRCRPLGGALIVAGIALVRLDALRAAPPPPAEAPPADQAGNVSTPRTLRRASLS